MVVFGPRKNIIPHFAVYITYIPLIVLAEPGGLYNPDPTLYRNLKQPLKYTIHGSRWVRLDPIGKGINPIILWGPGIFRPSNRTNFRGPVILRVKRYNVHVPPKKEPCFFKRTFHLNQPSFFRGYVGTTPHPGCNRHSIFRIGNPNLNLHL